MTEPETHGLLEGLTCPECGYDLRGLNAKTCTCPECGRYCSAAALAPSDEIGEKVAATLFWPAFGSLLGETLAVVAGGIALALPWPSSTQRWLVALAVAAPGGLLAAWSISRFRRRCGHAQGWLRALVRTHLAHVAAVLLIFFGLPIVVVSLSSLCDYVPATWRGAVHLTVWVFVAIVAYRVYILNARKDLLTRFLFGGLERIARIAAADLAAQRSGDAQ